MAEDDQDRTREQEAEREAGINAELERIGKGPEEVDAGCDSLGRQHSETGLPRESAGGPDEEDV